MRRLVHRIPVLLAALAYLGLGVLLPVWHGPQGACCGAACEADHGHGHAHDHDHEHGHEHACGHAHEPYSPANDDLVPPGHDCTACELLALACDVPPVVTVAGEFRALEVRSPIDWEAPYLCAARIVLLRGPPRMA